MYLGAAPFGCVVFVMRPSCMRNVNTRRWLYAAIEKAPIALAAITASPTSMYPPAAQLHVPIPHMLAVLLQ